MTIIAPDPGLEVAEEVSVPMVHKSRRQSDGFVFHLCLGWTILIVIVALTVQWLPLHSYVLTIGQPNQGPGFSTNLLGTDSVGRSLLSRLCYGARVSLAISTASTLIAMCVGAALGLLSVYLERIVAHIIDLIINTVLALPSLLLLLAIMLALQPTMPVLIGGISLVFIPTFTRLTKGNSLAQMNRDYVLVARSMGASGRRLMIREVLPNVLGPLVSYGILVLPAVIITEGTLSFLGFGVQSPTPSWGSMIAAAQPTLSQSPWQAVAPCFVLFVTVMSINTLGDRLRSKLDIADRNIA